MKLGVLFYHSLPIFFEAGSLHVFPARLEARKPLVPSQLGAGDRGVCGSLACYVGAGTYTLVLSIAKPLNYRVIFPAPYAEIF